MTLASSPPLGGRAPVSARIAPEMRRDGTVFTPVRGGLAAAAVEGLTRSLAAELGPQIPVNAIAPMLTDRPLAARLLGSVPARIRRKAEKRRHPLKGIGDPREIAGTRAWLLGDAASVTGQVIAVDAGLSSPRLI